MRTFKQLPFTVQLERKYNNINAEHFVSDWIESERNRKNRVISMCQDLHLELSKFNTFEIDINEMIDLGLRYALSKREFRSIIAEIIQYKNNIFNI